MEWRIWYADGTTLSGEGREAWANSPMSGVVSVASKLGTNRWGTTLGRFAAGGDWYWWQEDGIDCGTSTDARGEWISYDGPRDGWDDAKQGAWVSDEEYKAANEGMQEFLK